MPVAMHGCCPESADWLSTFGEVSFAIHISSPLGVEPIRVAESGSVVPLIVRFIGVGLVVGGC